MNPLLHGLKIAGILTMLLLSACNPLGMVEMDSSFLPGLTFSALDSELSVSATGVLPGQSVTLTARLKDRKGNAYPVSSAVVEFVLGSGTSVGTLGAVTEAGGGVYTTTFTGVSAGSARTVSARVNGELLVQTVALTVIGSTFSLANSTLALSAATVSSGSSVTATLTARDASNVPLPGGGLAVVFSHSGGGSDGTWGPTNDHGDGTYTAVFTGSTGGSATTVSASIMGSAITSALPTLTVTPGSVSTLSFATTPSTSGDTDTALAVQPVIVAKDATGNTVGGYTDAITLAAYSDTACTNAVTSGLSATANPVTASAGIAAFAGLKILKTNVRSIRATDGTRSACFGTLTVSPGAAASVSVSSGNAQTGAIGAVLGSAFVAVVKDANDNPKPGVTVAWAVTAGGGALSSASNATDANGLSSSTLTLGSAAGTHTATATVAALTPATFNATATAGSASKLAFSAEPSATGTAGVNLGTVPSVAIQDASGNTVTTATDAITLSLFSDAACTAAAATAPDTSASTAGTLTRNATTGVAAFSGLQVRLAGSALYFKATAGALASACSNAMNISPGAYDVAKSALTVSASTVVSGASITVTHAAKDSFGNANPSGLPAPAAITFSSSLVGGTGSFGATSALGSGVFSADFTGATAGAVTLGSSISGAAIAATANVTVTAGAVAAIAYSTPPSSSGTAGTVLAAQPVVTARDAAGNAVSGYSNAVTLSAYSDTACTTSVTGGLSATTNPVNASGGIATFAGVTVLKTTVRAMKASDGTLDVCSSALTIGAGTASVIAISSGNAQSAAWNASLASPLVVVVKDANDNVVSGQQVDWAVTVGGGTLGSATSTTDASGLASDTFTLAIAGSNSAQATIHGTSTSVTFTATGTTSALAHTWNLDTSTDYVFGSTVEFTGGAAQLVRSDQVDDDAHASRGFGGGTPVGADWDGANSVLRLASAGGCDGTGANCANRVVPSIYELHSSWAPEWANLRGYWKLNGSGNVSPGAAIPASVGTNGTAANANGSGFAYQAGKIGTALASDGVDDSVTLPTTVTDPADYTWAFWFNPARASVTGTDGVVASAKNTYTYPRLEWNSAGKLAFAQKYADDSGTYSILSAVLTTGTWYHVVAVAKGTGTATPTITLYINGVQSSTNTAAKAIYSIAGDHALFRNGTTYDFQGSIDDFAVWDKALSAGQISALYRRQAVIRSGVFTSRLLEGFGSSAPWTSLAWVPTLPFMKKLPTTNEVQTEYSGLVDAAGASGDSALADNLTLYYPLDEVAGTTGAGSVKDAKGTSNATPTSVTFGESSRVGTAVHFNGTTSYINTNYDFSFSLAQNASFAFWIKADTVTGNQGVMGKGQAGGYGTTNYEWSMRLTGNTLGFLYWNTGGNGELVMNTTIAAGEWNHIVVTFDPTAGAMLYKNGALITSDTVYSTALKNQSTPVLLGHAYYNGGTNLYFAGSLDEVAFWKRTLKAEEVKMLYRRGGHRVKFQVRSCATADATLKDCSDDPTGANWKGPDGSDGTYFSELYNMGTQANPPSGATNTGLPTMTFGNFLPAPTPSPNPYFQYRVVLENDSSTLSCTYGTCSPEIKSVTVAPVHYDDRSPTVVGNTGVDYYALATFLQNGDNALTAQCPGGTTYNLGVGATSGTAKWYWWDSSKASGCLTGGTGAWCEISTEDPAKSNSAAVVNTRASSFGAQVGTGKVFFKAFLKSSGAVKCELNNLDLTGLK